MKNLTSNLTVNKRTGLHLHQNIKAGYSYFDSSFISLGALIQTKGTKSITIEGVKVSGKTKTYGQEISFSREFKVGDVVEYDSYNLVYTGAIVNITAKTITVNAHGENKRMNLVKFIDKNWDLDLEKIRARNLETSYCI